MEASSPQAENHKVKRQLWGALWLLLVTVVAVGAGVWMSVKYSELARNLGQSQLAGAAAAAAPAGTIPLSGWMWSGYMGWISMSSDNKNESNTYAVYQNVTDGGLSGYAWSSNLGWVSFNAADVRTCPNNTATNGAAPRVNLSTGKVSGWARACSAFSGSACSGTLDSRSGGWDGCISLGTQTGETVTYGITQNLATCKWSGYAWGSTAIGWTNSNPIVAGISYGVTCERPNLKYVSAVPSPLSGSATAPVTYTATFTNDGGARTNSLLAGSTFPIHYSFRWADNSQGTNWTTMAPPAGFPTSADLAAGETVTKSVTFQFPANAAGTTRYISICADYNNTVIESNENDNCSGWVAVTIAGTPNLIAKQIFPTSVVAGQANYFNSTTTNSGSGATPSTTYTLISQGTSATGPWTNIGSSVSVPVLAPGAERLIRTPSQVTFPTAGTYYLRACADQGDVVPNEISETDNCVVTAITVTAAPSADYVPSNPINSVVPTPSTGMADIMTGQPVRFDGLISNTGNLGGTNVPNVFWIRDDNPVLANKRTFTRVPSPPPAIATVPAGATNLAVAPGQFSTSTPGAYTVTLCANMVQDGTQPAAEANKGNNCGNPYRVIITYRDLYPGVITANPSSVSANTPVTLSSVVTNNGTGEASDFRNVMQITNAARTVTYRWQDLGLISSLGPTGSAPVSYSYSTSTPGTFSVRLCVDKASETDTGTVAEWAWSSSTPAENNCGDWKDVVVTAALAPDLTVTALTPTTATNGQATTYSATVQNGGTAATSAGFTTLFQAAVTATGGGAVDIGTFSRATALSNTAGSNTFTATLSYATTTTRTSFYIRACADKTSATNTGVITESNEGNNCLSPWVQVTLNAAATVPTVTAQAATSITTNSATIGATVTSNGGAALTAAGTCLSTSVIPAGLPCPGQVSITPPAVGTPFTRNLTGLRAGTTYHYRGYATNSAGTGYTVNTTFTTPTLGITVSPKTYSPVWPASGATATYMLSNGTSANTVCRLLDFASVPVPPGTFSSCTGSMSVTAPSAVGGYGYYVQASSTNSTSPRVSDSFTVYVTSPYLTANGLTGLPSSVAPNTVVNLNGSINNASSTFPLSVANATAVPSVYRVKMSSGGTPIAYVTGGSKDVPKGSTGASAVALNQGTYTLTSGTYYFDICVNMNTSGTVPVVSEARSNDNCGPESSVQVTSNASPIANAGPDKSITQPASSASPTGTSATDSDGTVTSTIWSSVSRPAGAPSPSITNASTLNPTFTNLTTVGTYVFRLTVTDNQGATGTDTMQVVVSSDPGGGADPSITCTRNPNTSITTGQSVAFTVTPADGAAGPYQIRNGGTTLCTPTGSPATCSATFGTAGTFSITAQTTSASPTPGLSAPCGADIVVSPAGGTAPTNVTLSADPLTVQDGDQTTLTWSSQGTTLGCTISRLYIGATTIIPASGPPLAASGEMQDTVYAEGETVYTLTCSNSFGSTSSEPVVVEGYPRQCEIGQPCFD